MPLALLPLPLALPLALSLACPGSLALVVLTTSPGAVSSFGPFSTSRRAAGKMASPPPPPDASSASPTLHPSLSTAIVWLAPLIVLLQVLLLLRALRAHLRLSLGDVKPKGTAPPTSPPPPPPPEEEASGASTRPMPLVRDLLAAHAAELAALRSRAELKGCLELPAHDDLHLLRYLLSSKGNVAKAATNLRKAAEWRKEHAAILQPDALERVRREAHGWSPTAMLPRLTRGGMPVTVAAPFLADLDAKPPEFHFLSGIANREEFYTLCDKLTRESGRLTKLVIIQDLRGFSFGDALRFSKLQGNLSKLSEFLYPQLVAVVVVAHPPAVINRLHALLKPLISKNLLEKMRLAPTHEDVAMESDVPRQHLPTFLGGDFHWTTVSWAK